MKKPMKINKQLKKKKINQSFKDKHQTQKKLINKTKTTTKTQKNNNYKDNPHSYSTNKTKL
jgi:hypothetical protein